MRFKLVFLLYTILVSATILAQGNETMSRKISLIADLGIGVITPGFDESEDKYTSTSEMKSFKSNPNLSSSLGVRYKVGFIEIEAKFGVNYMSYSIYEIESNGGPGYSYDFTNQGTAHVFAGYIQPTGIYFGKSYEWGSFNMGPFIRFNLNNSINSTGTKHTEGYKWNGSMNIGVDTTSNFEAPFTFGSRTIGAAFNTNFNLTPKSQINVRVEFLTLHSSLYEFSASQAYISVGYVLVLKRDKVKFN